MKEFKIRIHSRDDFEKVVTHTVLVGYLGMKSEYYDSLHALYLQIDGLVKHSGHPFTFQDCNYKEISVSDFLRLTKKDTQSEPVGANNPAGEKS